MPVIINGTTGIITPNDTVSGNVSIANALTVTGNAVFSNTITVTGNTTFSNTMVVTGNVVFSNTITVTGNTTFSNTMVVTGNVVFSNTVNLAASGIKFSDNTTQTTANKPLTQMTQFSTSTSSLIDFSGIPSWTKKITMSFYTVSINGSSIPTVRLGTSGGIVSSGYFGTQEGASASGPAFRNLDTGFDLLDSGTAINGANFCGILTIVKLGTGNDWVANWVAGMVNSPPGMMWMGGAVSLDGPLTTVRLTTRGGTVQFTGGTMNVMYE